MCMDNAEKFGHKKRLFLKANAKLQEALTYPRSEMAQDSLIQRFEFVYELGWQLLRERLIALGVEAHFPKEVVQNAVKFHPVDDGNIWTEIIRNRNLTSHTYSESLAREVYDFVVSTAADEFQILAVKAEQWN